MWLTESSKIVWRVKELISRIVLIPKKKLFLLCVSQRKSKVGFYNPKTDFAFFSKQITRITWCIKEIEESLPRVDCSVPLMHHDPSDLWLICLAKKYKIRFWILEFNLGFSWRNAPLVCFRFWKFKKGLKTANPVSRILLTWTAQAVLNTFYLWYFIILF